MAAAFALVATLIAASTDAAEDQAVLLRDAFRAEQEGRLSDAAALYARAHRGWPQDVVAARGSCEVGLAIAANGTLGPGAVEACHRAFLLTHSPRDMRNKVAALLTEKAKPDLDTVAIASLVADASVKQAPDQPWGHLARYDVARHLGRADLLATSRRDLEPFAASERLVRAALEDRVGRPPVWVWLLRAFILLGLVGTGLHAFAHRRRHTDADRTTLPSHPAEVLVVLFSLLVSSQALAVPADMPVMKNGQISPFKIDDAHPEAAVKTLLEKTKDPLQLGYLLQDLAVRADAANKKGDNATAARYYHALAVAAPTPYGPRKECQALEAIGDIPNAISACRELLTRTGAVVDDYVHFVELVLKNPKPLHELEPKELEGVIAHLEKEAKTGNLPTVLRCKVAMRFDDRTGLEKCATAMSLAPADDPTVISIKWGLAVRRQDKPAALLLVEQARMVGVSADNVARMLQTTNAITRRKYQRAGFIGALGVCSLVAAFVAMRLLMSLRRRTTSGAPA